MLNKSIIIFHLLMKDKLVLSNLIEKGFKNLATRSKLFICNIIKE